MHGGELSFGWLRRHSVVNHCGVNVGNLLVDLAIRNVNLAYALQLLFEILIAADGATGLNALVVHHVVHDSELFEDA